MRTRKAGWLVAVLAGGALLLGHVGRAEAQVPKRKVIRLDEISVEGRIQKPQAFYILPRSSLNYSSLDRPDSFLPKITKSLEQDPF